MRPAAEPIRSPRGTPIAPDLGVLQRGGAHRGRRPGLALAWIRTGLLAGFVIAGLVALAPPDKAGRRAGEPRVTASIPSAASRETDSPWRPVAGPALALSGAEWRGRDVTVTARRNVGTGAREDILTAGAFSSPASYLHLVATRDSRTAPAGSLFLAVARRAAAAGLAVSRTGPSAPLGTKFGAAEIAPLTLASGAGERACTALRLKRPEGGFGIEGWLCAPQGQPAAESKLACALDGLALASGASEASLKALFADADKRRPEGCDGPERTVVASGRAFRSERR